MLRPDEQFGRGSAQVSPSTSNSNSSPGAQPFIGDRAHRHDLSHDGSASETRLHPAEPCGAGPHDPSPRQKFHRQSSDAYYPQNLRAGFIDIRNSYSEKRRTKFTAYPARSAARSSDGEGEGGRTPDNTHSSGSCLDLESIEYIDAGMAHMQPHSGSTSSLDLIGSVPQNGQFFDMLQDFGKKATADQRAPPPKEVHKVLGGKASVFGAVQPSFSGSTAPGYVHPKRPLNDGGSQQGTSDGFLRSQTKRKSQRSKERKQSSKSVVAEMAGLLLNGKNLKKSSSETVLRSMERKAYGELRPEDRQRWKAFVHYDCQSICFCFSKLLRKLSGLANSNGTLAKGLNTATGASAASSISNVMDVQEAAEDSDDGDGKSNDLVLSCPHFRNEVGGEEQKSIALNIDTAQKNVQQLLGNQNMDTQTLMRPPVCNGVSVLDLSMGPHGHRPEALLTNNGLVFEYVDQGAYYYRNFFNGMDHQNFFGIDDVLGPVAISLKREKLAESDRETPTGRQENAGHCYQYRVILRTSELQTLRGSVLEEAIPSSSRLSNTRGLPPKDLLEHLLPNLSLSCLRLATSSPKTSEQLMKLDEQGIFKGYKFGVLLCKRGQSSEEDMYNNEHATPAFQEFLSLLGEEKRLKGFEKYRGGLDTKHDSTGTHCVYRELHGYEIVFHVSTMLPFSPNNKQQLLRKRHIGNDIVTLVFQEPGSKPFTPKSVRSQFQHVFIVVRAHNPNTSGVKYSLSIARAKVVPPFGPAIPDSVMFSKSPKFAEFLLTKAINAENAVHRSKKLAAMAMRTRQEYLRDLALNFTTNTPIDSGSKLGKFSLGSGRRKEKPKTRTFPDVFSKGAVVWNVLVEDFGQMSQVDCYLGIAAESLVVVDSQTGDVTFTVPTGAVIGWTPQGNSLRIYYHHGECILLQTYYENSEITEIVNRLTAVTEGCETIEKTMQKDAKGQLGFHIYFEGVISNVEPQGVAWVAGLRAGSRLVEICKDSTASMTHDQMLNLLRNASTVKLVYIPPNEDGTARRYLTGKSHEDSLPTGRPHSGSYISPAKPSPENTFQEELRKLLDPDLSFGGSDTVDTSQRKAHDSQRNAESALTRAHSHESICGVQNKRRQWHAAHQTPRRATTTNSASDILFTTAKPARAVLRMSPEEPTHQHKAMWNSVGDNIHKSGANASLQLIHELESANMQLREALHKEQRHRKAAEDEIDALRLDNVRLQEEAHAAAAQLRKFTEWFFKNIEQE